MRGTFRLLQESLAYWRKQSKPFRFVQVSTDEVFGDLGPADAPFTEDSPYLPHSPYAASKASADHLVRSWHHTYGFPALITHCSNNYGSRQHPEKLIPRLIRRALFGESCEIHGDGSNVRDWISVEDHCRGIWLAYERGALGRSYCFGGGAERTNLEVAERIIVQLGQGYLECVGDRPGNDRRYAINFSRARAELGWTPKAVFEEGLSRTVSWYKANQHWCDRILHPVSR